jgi:hypothetical protein
VAQLSGLLPIAIAGGGPGDRERRPAYGASSWTGVHMSKCPNAALKAIPSAANATTRITLTLIFKRVGFLNRRSPDMLHSPADVLRVDT